MKNKNTKNNGFVLPLVAIIAAGAALFLVFFLLVFFPYLYHYVAGLVGGGNQPVGSCNVGCCFDESKIGLYTSGGTTISDAESEEAKNFAINTLQVDPSMITVFDKSLVENMIRSEVECQWNKLTSEQQHGATQTDAQHAVLAYQEHESSPFQLFKKEGERLVPSLTHDSSGTCTNILSITADKWGNNKRKQIALYWDIKYDIYLGVQENISNFVNRASGSGKERWRNALGITFLPGDPGRYWRQSSAEIAWKKYQNEVAYHCSVNNSPFCSQCGQKIIDQVKLYAGLPYSQDSHCGPNTIGPSGVSAVDCSGLASRVYRDLGLFPSGTCFRTATIRDGSATALNYLQEIKAEEVRTGDLIFSGTGSTGHVVIFVSGNVLGKFTVWESGGGGTSSVAQETRSVHNNQRYFRAKNCL